MSTRYMYDENVDLEEWGALLRAAVNELASQLETAQRDRDKQSVAWLLRNLVHQMSGPHPIENVRACVAIVREWGDALLRHLASSNQERESDQEIAFDPTPRKDYDQIECFFFVIEEIRKLRSRTQAWNDEHATADVITELFEGPEDVANRVPTNRWNWKADQQQIQYFLAAVLEPAIFSQYAELLPKDIPSYHFGDIRGVGPQYLGETASGSTTMYITLALGAGVLWYLNRKGYLKT